MSTYSPTSTATAEDVIEECREADAVQGLSDRISKLGTHWAHSARGSLEQVVEGAECFARREPYKALAIAAVLGGAAGLLARRVANSG